MFESIRKSLLMGLGAGVVTKEKVDQVTNRLVEEGKISREEAEKLAQELLQGESSQWEDFQETIRQMITNVISSMSIPRAKDIQDLKTRMDKVEKRLSELEISSKRMMGEE